MRRAVSQIVLATMLFAFNSGAMADDAFVEFDFARSVECRDVTPMERIELYPQQRLVELVLPVSVRFRGVALDDVDELTVEISGAAAGLRVLAFAPATQLTSDVADGIETTTTTKKARSIDATLGGNLPVPAAEAVAHISPSITAGASSGETTTEKLNRLSPKHAVVVSGTLLEGRGVFFKLKRYSQTSLEGVHDFAVTFVAPTGWRGGEVHIACSASGRRKVLWMNQSATLGQEGDAVRLYLASRGVMRRVAKPVLAEVNQGAPQSVRPEKQAAPPAATASQQTQQPDRETPELAARKTKSWSPRRDLIDNTEN
jgi:hypothetical protein